MAVSSYFNRVQFTATNSGSVDFHVDAAVQGYRTPAQAGITNGAIVSYVALTLSGNGANATIAEWETGQGTYTSATQTLSRTTIRESTNGNNKVVFSKAPTVFLDYQAQDIGSGTTAAAIEFVIDGGGSPVTSGIKGDLEIPFGCVIQRATTLADTTGSVAVNIWKNAFGSFPPTSTNKITSNSPPTISAGISAQDSTLSGWTTAITAGDILRYNVDTATSVGRVTVSLYVIKS